MTAARAYDQHTTQWRAADRVWTAAMGGLRGMILSVANDTVTVQLFDKPFHIRTVRRELTWMFNKELTLEEIAAQCSMG